MPRIWPLLAALSLAIVASRCRAETWADALAGMPLGVKVAQLNRTNCVDLILPAFQSNQTVKALIFMPGATDELYFFRRAKARLTNDWPTLLDAVTALTNQTEIRVTFQPPFLLLHSDEDPLELQITTEHPPTADKLKKTPFLPHVVYNDRDWDVVQPNLKKKFKTEVKPWRHSHDSWHFYRHSLAGWYLNGWEAMQAVALAGKEKVFIRRKEVDFECDPRYRKRPTLDAFPHD